MGRKIVSSQKVRAISEKIPLNPPLQKGEAIGMPELIEKLRKIISKELLNIFECM